MRNRWQLMAAALVTLFAASVAAETIETATGPVDVAKVDRVAVYDIAALDTLKALGVDVVGVPNRVYLPNLEAATKGATVIGTLFEPDLEALNATEPDLVIVANRSSPMAKATRRVAPTIDMTIWGENHIEQTFNRIDDYGRLFQREGEADALKRDIEAAVERARAAADGKGTALIVLTNGPKISVFGDNSRYGWLHREIGIAPAAEGLAAATHGEAVSFEYVAQTDPDWLIVLDRAAAIGASAQGAKATLDNALIEKTKAWSSNKVIYLPAAELYIAPGGARSIIRVLSALADGFQEASSTPSQPLR